MTSHLCTPLEDGFEEHILLLQLSLAFLTHQAVDFFPLIRDDNDIPEGPPTAEFLEHSEVLSQRPSHPVVGDLVEVEDTGELDALPVSVCRKCREAFSCKNCMLGFRKCIHVYLRGFEESRDHVKNVDVAPHGVVESGSIDQNDPASVQIEGPSRLYGVRAGF